MDTFTKFSAFAHIGFLVLPLPKYWEPYPLARRCRLHWYGGPPPLVRRAASIGTKKHGLHWYGGPPPLVRRAASIGTKKHGLHWYGGPPPLVRRAASIGTEGSLRWYGGPPPFVRRAASIGTKGRLQWYEGQPPLVRRCNGNALLLGKVIWKQTRVALHILSVGNESVPALSSCRMWQSAWLIA